MNNHPTQTTATSAKTKVILIAAVVVLVMAGILYGIGLSRGRSQLASQRTGYENQIQTLQGQLKTGQTELAASRNQTRLIEARSRLFRTAIDLEQRNFGIANTHLHESASILGQVQSADGLDMVRLDALKEAIAKTDINVAVDLEGQRDIVLEFAKRLEALTPQPAIAESPTE